MTLLTNQSTKQTTTLKQKMMGGALAGVLMTTLGVAAPMMALTQSATAAPADNTTATKR
ncbi:MAG TPA: outer membrane lipoprotein carrier protein LolA, partial [Psychrobacter sp.]|nr:outer membrane lipoprotein carrier protein LolA [Psychrobacter sp.]